MWWRRLGLGVLVVVLLLSMLGVSGCPERRTPSPPATPTPTRPETKTLPTDPRELSRIATNLAHEAARVPGVNKATVAIAGNTAYVGLDLKAGLEKGRTDEVKREVATRLKKAEPRLAQVMVTTDADTYNRIKNVQDGITKGKPLSSFAHEIEEINRRMSPTT
ncbi:sporulation lipoprotein, YhcN/YlaJ family [Ammonifex degensii KC4]|uniref:Sporulation lipoprotein, YhcN/YlaJ family n=1 Tax=Ammonifex degensii (strain DSM 10501 / KC4) TaxID=429009 RepID=C9RCM9_AMMDK|nr:YhcN/YlaJ family sporulation lipoprotein [Ammonifex degensii]ACX52006.1 sporulation lipoprotein, YhcN/YlaJ family [Ammonifex degensii KC4]